MFAPPEPTTPDTPKVEENKPGPEVKKASAAVPLLVLAAIAYFAFKG
jgi:hypothetical protein